MNLNTIMKSMPGFINAAGYTLSLTVIAIMFGVFIGLFLALARISKNKVLNSISFFYIWVFRGTPLMLQIFFIYYALPLISPSLKLDCFPAGFVALGLNSAAYLAEIIRAAIQSIDKGQMEAAKALGMGYAQAMRIVIIPQSYRRLIPPVGNEVIALLKDTSLVSVVSLTELLKYSTDLANSSASAIYYIPCALFYLFFTTLLTILFSKLEKHYSVYE